MPFRFNPITGTLDLVNRTITPGSGVVRIGPTTDKAISRWAGTNSDTIQGSKTLVQDGGGVEAQGFITNRLITDTLTIHADQAMITAGFAIEPSGELVIEADGELVVV